MEKYYTTVTNPNFLQGLIDNGYADSLSNAELFTQWIEDVPKIKVPIDPHTGQILDKNYLTQYSNIGQTNTATQGLSTMTTPSLIDIGIDMFNGSGLAKLYSNSNNPLTTNQDNSAATGLGWNVGTLGAIGQGLQGLGALWSAYNAVRGLELAEDQFDFQTALARRNIANQAKIINNKYDTAANVAAGLAGVSPYTKSDGSIGYTNQSILDAYRSNAQKRHVSDSI